MKQILVIILFCVFIVGCEIDDPTKCDNTIHSTTTETVSKIGLLLLPGDNMYMSLSEMDAAYIEMQSCVGMIAVAPTVWYTDFDTIGLGGGWSAYSYPDQHVMINTNVAEHLTRNCVSDRDAMKHEFVHHILFMNDEDSTHASPLFEKCAIGVKTCNGVAC